MKLACLLVRAVPLVALVALSACSKSGEPPEPRLGMAPQPVSRYERPGGHQPGFHGQPGTPAHFQAAAGDLVYFGSDSSELLPEARQTLDAQARWLQQFGQAPVLIEGHADERGTREYNIALGSRRAAAVRDYLMQRGIDPRRIRMVSLGKERPVAVCNDISCWSKNRRAQTLVNGAPMAMR